MPCRVTETVYAPVSISLASNVFASNYSTTRSSRIQFRVTRCRRSRTGNRTAHNQVQVQLSFQDLLYVLITEVRGQSMCAIRPQKTSSWQGRGETVRYRSRKIPPGNFRLLSVWIFIKFYQIAIIDSTRRTEECV